MKGHANPGNREGHKQMNGHVTDCKEGDKEMNDHAYSVYKGGHAQMNSDLDCRESPLQMNGHANACNSDGHEQMIGHVNTVCREQGPEQMNSYASHGYRKAIKS